MGFYFLYGVWRSLVARTAGGREVAGSNPVAPITVGDRIVQPAYMRCGFTVISFMRARSESVRAFWPIFSRPFSLIEVLAGQSAGLLHRGGCDDYTDRNENRYSRLLS